MTSAASLSSPPVPPSVCDVFETRIHDHLALCHEVLSCLKEPFTQVVQLCCNALSQGGTLFFFGNGGSAADAQHLATEFVVRFSDDRPAMAAMALGADSVLLTAAGNDYGFEHVFARHLQALGKPGDVAIGLTTSGQSPNIHAAFKAARAQNMTCISFTSVKGHERLAPLCDHLLSVPSRQTARIQEMHILLGHMLCEAVERTLFPTVGE